MKIPTGRLAPAVRIAVPACGAIAILGALGVAFNEPLTLALRAPRAPFAAIDPPARPEYASREAWALWKDAGVDGQASTGDPDIFYVHSTTAHDGGVWNAPAVDPAATESLRGATAPAEIGPFAALGVVYAPLYRQPGLFAWSTNKPDSLAARALAYDDVSRAFSYFLKRRDADRPFMIVAYGGGAHLAAGLLQERFADGAPGGDELRASLIAAYLIDHPLPDDAGFSVPICRKATGTGCIVSYAAVAEPDGRRARALRARALLWRPGLKQEWIEAPRLACVTPAGANAVCVDGLLVVDGVSADDLPPRPGLRGRRDTAPFNPLSAALSADAAGRLAAYSAEIASRPRRQPALPPISDSLDLQDSPINKVPD